MQMERKVYSKTSKQRTQLEMGHLSLYRGCPLLSGFLLNLMESYNTLRLKMHFSVHICHFDLFFFFF